MPSGDDRLVEVSPIALIAQCSALLVEEGLSYEGAQRAAASLVDADRSGRSSHGIAMLPLYVRRLRAGSVTANDVGEVVSDRGATAVIDGRHALGILIGDQAMSLAVQKAGELGAGLVGVRHAFHFGMAARYTTAAASAGCIGIAMSSTRPMISAPGSSMRLVGTNPIAISVPTSGDIPLDLDMAMSVASMGRIREAAGNGTDIPVDWAKDPSGDPTTHPDEAIDGSLQPIAGYKGFGLALMVDLICGLISGGAMGGEVNPLFDRLEDPYNCSQMFAAIHLGAFGQVDALRARAEAQAERIRNSPSDTDSQAATTPGQRSHANRIASGAMVKVPASALLELAELATASEVSAGFQALTA